MPQTRKARKHSGGKKKTTEHIRYDGYLKTLHALEKKLEKICIILWTHTWHKFPEIWMPVVTPETLKRIKFDNDVINELSKKCVKSDETPKYVLGLFLNKFPQIKEHPREFITWRNRYGDPAMKCTQYLSQLKTLVELYRMDKKKTKKRNDYNVFAIRADHLEILAVEYNDLITKITKYVEVLDENYDKDLKTKLVFDELLTHENFSKYLDSNSQAKSLPSLSPHDGVNLQDSNDPFQLQITNTHLSPSAPRWDSKYQLQSSPSFDSKKKFDLTVPGLSLDLKKRPIGRPTRRSFTRRVPSKLGSGYHH